MKPSSPMLPALCLYLLLLFTFNLLRFEKHIAASALGNETDHLALLKFKESISNDPYKILASWNSSSHFCNWFGITCSHRHQRVTELRLGGYSLHGFISPHVGNLSFLRTLLLHNNSFYGKIPEELGRLFRLQILYLDNNTLAGEIFPTNLTSCSELKELGLRRNDLIGQIPFEIGILRKLQVLAIDRNNFTGQIPPSIGNLSSLIFLSAIENNLEGNIPEEISCLKNLQKLRVGENKLSAHVSDFGLARLLSTTTISPQQTTNTVGIKGTIGYAPPEYGMGFKVSIEGDMYSFGILVLEMLSGRRPTDEMFIDGHDLHNFVKLAIPNNLLQIVDPTILPMELEHAVANKENLTLTHPNVEKCLLSLFKIGLACSVESSKERMNMVNVIKELNQIRKSFQFDVRSREANYTTTTIV